MKISTEKLDSLVDELRDTRVDVKYSKEVYDGYPEYEVYSDSIKVVGKKLSGDEEKKAISNDVRAGTYIPFEITINDTYTEKQNTLFADNLAYRKHIDDIKESVQLEIDDNINLRLGKWDILDYFATCRMNIYKVSQAYFDTSKEIEDMSGVFYFNNSITLTANRNDPMLAVRTDKWVSYVLSKYFTSQVDCLERILNYIKIREGIIEKSDDYVRDIAEIPQTTGILSWEKSDTDLLELITALLETKSIQNRNSSITRKEAISVFSEIFGIEIKDAESKLTRATNRKKDVSQYLTQLKEKFEDYSQKKLDNLDMIR